MREKQSIQAIRRGDTFVLLFLYAEEEHLIKRGKISIELFHKDVIVRFLEWLEIKRRCEIFSVNLDLL